MTEAKKYWHELPQEEIESLIEKKVNNQFVIDNYLQPDWCTYPDALMGVMGCWSLTDNTVGGLRTSISHDYCKDCDCYKKPNSDMEDKRSVATKES